MERQNEKTCQNNSLGSSASFSDGNSRANRPGGVGAYAAVADAAALYEDSTATLDDLREALTTLEDAGLIARRVFGSAHPLTTKLEVELRDARAALRAREETPSGGA